MAKRLYKLGSLAQDTVTGLMTIFKVGLKDKYSTLEAPKGTQYQVPVGKNFYITRVSSIGDIANTVFELFYGDDAVDNAAAPPTNVVYIAPPYCACLSDNWYPIDVFFKVPAGKYPGAYVKIGNCIVEIQGIEI